MAMHLSPHIHTHRWYCSIVTQQDGMCTSSKGNHPSPLPIQILTHFMLQREQALLSYAGKHLLLNNIEYWNLRHNVRIWK